MLWRLTDTIGLYTALVIFSAIVACRFTDCLYSPISASAKGTSCFILSVNVKKAIHLRVSEFIVFGVTFSLYPMALLAASIWTARVGYAFIWDSATGSDGMVGTFEEAPHHLAFAVVRDVMAVMMTFVADSILVSLSVRYPLH
jgi:hypothetical protein